jgi:hypothetical protein
MSSFIPGLLSSWSSPASSGRAETTAASGEKSEPLDQRDDEQNDRDDQQNVNGGTEEVEPQESDQPKNQENDDNIPKHKIVSPAGASLNSGESLADFASTAILIGKAPISATVSLL